MRSLSIPTLSKFGNGCGNGWRQRMIYGKWKGLSVYEKRMIYGREKGLLVWQRMIYGRGKGLFVW